MTPNSGARRPLTLPWIVTLGALVLAPSVNRAAWCQVPALLKKAEHQRVAKIAFASDRTLAIFSPDLQGGGSGVLISPEGYALTNFHVADPCGMHLRCGMFDSMAQQSQIFDAVIVGLDPVGDLALIKLLGKGQDLAQRAFPAVQIKEDVSVQVGDECFAAGNPFLLADDFQPTITWGIVSGMRRYQFPANSLLEYTDCIQTDAAINPGNSGGPLFDAEGRLIGINGRGSFEKRGRVNVGVGYAISMNQVRNFLGSLKSGRILDHSSLGFLVSTANDRTVRVSEVDANSDAFRQGIRYDDEILTVAGRTMKTANDVQNVLGTFPDFWKVPVRFRGEDGTREVLVRLRPVHSTQQLLQLIGRGTSPQKRPSSQDPPNPNPSLPEPQRQPKKVPTIVEQRFQSRRGYANYFFNRQETGRVSNAIGKFHALPDTSVEKVLFRGLAGPDEFQLVVSTTGSGLRIGEESFTIAEDSPLENQTAPLRSGGVLNLLSVWCKLVQSGSHFQGGATGLSVTYLGTAPWIPPASTNFTKAWSDRRLVDVIRVRQDGTETLFYVKENGELIAAEYFSFPTADPSIVEFSNYQTDSASGRWPTRIKASFRGRVYGAFEVKSVALFASKPANDTQQSNPKETAAAGRTEKRKKGNSPGREPR